MKLFVFIFSIAAAFHLSAQPNSSAMSKETNNLTPFEKNNNYSASYQEVMFFYRNLANGSDYVRIESRGMTDVGRPLEVIVIDKSGSFDPQAAKEEGKLVFMINNAIHAGEPCGVDASMMLARDLATDEKYAPILDKAVVVIIPMYNIGGALNRGSYSRANQNGPIYHGFRGNARNLDLNRDFIKCDSENAKSYTRLFSAWLPDVIMDTHTTNGSDYQYTMTLVAAQRDLLGEPLGSYLHDEMLPEVEKSMKEKGWDLSPYVYARSTPDEGIAAFVDLPRYSSGFGTLHHALSLMPEAHMLKPFADRVKSTYDLLLSMLEISANERQTIHSKRQESIKRYAEQEMAVLLWEFDPDRKSSLMFKGYEAKTKKSEVTGMDRLYYDRDAPYEKEIDYFNRYRAAISVKKPVGYIVPQTYREVIRRLLWNGVKLSRLEEDREIEVEYYYIKDYDSSDRPYESHYLHSAVEVELKTGKRPFYRGDYIVYCDQEAQRFLLETLEPQAPDSYFAWNFFDGVLMQKEYFSSYVFEEVAAQMLQKDASLKAELEKEIQENPEMKENARAQLNFIYQRSVYKEDTHMLYPVARLLGKVN